MSQPLSVTTADASANPVFVGLLGRGIGGSRTPRMHMAAAKAQGIDFDYQLLDTQVRKLPEDPAGMLDALEAEGFTGLNVTYPYKRQVLRVMDDLSDAARNVGAVNTVLFRDGKRYGDNTDHWGFAESLRRGLPGVPKDAVLLLGAGGAGGAVAHALLDEGVDRLLVCDVTRGMAEDLVTLLTAQYGGGRAVVAADAAVAAVGMQGIVNATPVGMEKLPGIPLPADALRPDQWVADIVYFPLETQLLAAAREKGCAVLPGSGMALFQAVRAYELFTGRKPDIERMREAFDSFS